MIRPAKTFEQIDEALLEVIKLLRDLEICLNRKPMDAKAVKLLKRVRAQLADE